MHEQHLFEVRGPKAIGKDLFAKSSIATGTVVFLSSFKNAGGFQKSGLPSGASVVKRFAMDASGASPSTSHILHSAIFGN
jgi:hypothetical protein